ncbi:MAG TPA: PAS domain S-box protein [Caulobacteraceae bacterium]|nr:PAS domain S-box protein [Caulobacteraceae bacterium]
MADASRDTEPAAAALAAAIVDNAPEAIIVAKPDGEIEFLNRAAVGLFGYAPAEAVGQNIAMLVPPDPHRRADAVRWLRRWAAEPLGEQSRYLDFLARPKDGREMYVEVRVAQSGDERFIITVRDDTVRRRDQIALKEANLRAARILLVAEDAIVSCDDRQAITFFNLKAESMFGYRAEEVLGQPLTMLMPPEARTPHPAFVEAFRAAASPSRMMSERQEIKGLRRSGEIFPLEAAITKVTLAGETTFTAHLRDITARKAAQASLEESERRFRALFDHAVGPMALLDPDGGVLEINSAARALTIGDQHYFGRPLWTLPWLGSPDIDSDAIERLKRAIAAAHVGVGANETIQLEGDGRVRTIAVWVTPIFDAARKVIYILAEGHEQALPG